MVMLHSGRLFFVLSDVRFHRFMQRDNHRPGENDETAAKAGISPPPKVFSLHSLSFTSPHIAGFCFFIRMRRFSDLRHG